MGKGASMTRAEAYAQGFAEGCRWAEQDIRDGHGATFGTVLLDMSRTANEYRSLSAAHDHMTAETLGSARGYRDTVARFEAGTLTFEMFEQERESPRVPMERSTR